MQKLRKHQRLHCLQLPLAQQGMKPRTGARLQPGSELEGWMTCLSRKPLPRPAPW